MLIDSHCHLNCDELREDAEVLVSRARDAGVFRMLLVGCDLENSLEAVEMAHRFASQGVYASIGVHPHEASLYRGALPQALLNLASDDRVVAIGEAGLDYYYEHSPREEQKTIFRLQRDWALALELPLILHIRDAMPDALEILGELPEKERASLKLLFHCYSGGLEYLDEVLALGASCALGGALTWKKSDELREVAAKIPLDRLLLETDCPWMAPKPFRGKLNEPSYVRFVYETVAEVRGLQRDALEHQIARNADDFFGWGEKSDV